MILATQPLAVPLLGHPGYRYLGFAGCASAKSDRALVLGNRGSSMSSATGASSESCAIDVAVPRVTSQSVGIARTGNSLRIGDAELSGSETPLRSIGQGGSVSRAREATGAETAGTDLRAAVLGYASICAEQEESANAELRRQVEEIASECERRGLRLLEVVREQARQHQQPLTQPGLDYVLGRLAAGEASGLVVSELSRVSHSLPQLGQVLEWLSGRDHRFVVATPGLDTDDEAGRLVVRTIIEISRWERQRLVERTRNGMRAARRKGPASVADYPQLRERIARMRAEGMTLQAIANQLNAERIPTVRGGAEWRPSSVQSAAGYQRRAASHPLDL
jgi:DNA invertase Pin-like site-specific DNA recombinase